MATLGIFLMPWALAAAAAQQLQRFVQHPWLQNFGRGAAPAVVGLLVVTALHLARNAFTSEVHAGIAGVALGLTLWLFTGVFRRLMGLTGAMTWIAKLTSRPVVHGIILGLGLGCILEGVRMMEANPALALLAAILTFLLLSHERIQGPHFVARDVLRAFRDSPLQASRQA